MPKAVLTDMDFGGAAKAINLLAPTATTDAATKGYVDGRTPKITASTTAPSSPAVGDVWIDTN